MIKNSKKLNKKIISLIVILSILFSSILAYLFYWIYAYNQIKNFTTVSLEFNKENIIMNNVNSFYNNSNTIKNLNNGVNNNIVGKYITIDNVKIHYIANIAKKSKATKSDNAVNGSKSIILIHGFGGGTFSYRFNIDYLAVLGYDVYAIDLKGFGYSERILNSDYSHFSQAKIIKDFILQKNLKEVILVGHSMGGRIAVMTYDLLVKTNPEIIKKIILIDSSGLENFSNTDNENKQNIGNKKQSFLNLFLNKLINQSIVDILYYNIFLNQHRFKDILTSAYYDKSKIDSDWISLYLMPFKIKNTNKVYNLVIKSQVSKSNLNYDIVTVLKNIKVPVLVVWGEYDNWISIENAYKFKKLIKNSQLQIISNSGHLPMEESPEVFNEKIKNFLKEF